MSDAYYPADDIGMMASGQAALDRDRAPREPAGPFPERRLTDAQGLACRDACAANGIKFTEHDGGARTMAATRANHCAQARAGYSYCRSTRSDPCGYSAANPYPHAHCSDAQCLAGEGVS